MIAFVPARRGSTRCPGKNMRMLGGEPMIAWTLRAAAMTNILDDIVVASDDEAVLSLAARAGCKYIRRRRVSSTQPDIDWVREALTHIARPDVFAILRPTSPFRTAETIRRAHRSFFANDCADSIRAVEPVKHTPFKMWTWEGEGMPMEPLLPGSIHGTPFHSSPTQVCPPVYIQNSSLEIAWTRNIEVYGTIHGRTVAPFFTQGYEGFSVDIEADWADAERLVREGHVTLPALSREVGRVPTSAPAQ